MNHGSLFSGVGGFDLAAEWMGWENKFHCEWNEFCKRVLKYYWPDAKSYGDIDKTDFTIWRGCIDVLSGGFPCQPYSTAGKRQGKEDVRHKWPQMLRAIREIQPGYVVGENVRGLTNWNGGMVFDEVQADLEAEGYEVLPFLLPACGVNADHRRDRIWFIAHNFSIGRRKTSEGRLGLEERILRQSRWDKSTVGYKARINQTWLETATILCSSPDGVSRELDGITFSKWRNESIKSYGNAIVPQIVFQLFKVIEQINQWQKV